MKSRLFKLLRGTMMPVRLKPQHRELSTSQLEDKAYELGFSFQRFSRSCSQSVVSALHELIEIDDNVVKAATSCTGGQISQSIGTCGGLIGGTIVLDYFFGRSIKNTSSEEFSSENSEAFMNAQGTAFQLYKKFISEYGTILCPSIQAQLIGRHYYLWELKDMSEFEIIGGYRKSADVIGNSARWVMEILLNNRAFNS